MYDANKMMFRCTKEAQVCDIVDYVQRLNFSEDMALYPPPALQYSEQKL